MGKEKHKVMNEEVIEKLKQLEQDIEAIKVQGATNVALATLEGMELASKAGHEDVDVLEFIESTGFKLSKLRENEPLARNAVKYVLSHITKEDKEHLADEIHRASDEFKQLIKDANVKIKEYGVTALSNYDIILTHCHSSTATSALIELAKMKPELKVVSTETRPLYQGRKTSKELAEAGVNTTMIVDGAAASFIADDRYLPVEAVLIGADEILFDGGFINKIGSYAMALAAKAGDDELYVAASLLKIDLENRGKLPNIELRPAREIMEEEIEGLRIINPSLEYVPANLVTGFITEAGILRPEEVELKAHDYYNWM